MRFPRIDGLCQEIIFRFLKGKTQKRHKLKKVNENEIIKERSKKGKRKKRKNEKEKRRTCERKYLKRKKLKEQEF